MAVLTQWRFLSSARLNRIVGTLAAELEIKRPLIWLERLPLVPADDDELTGRFTGKILAADIIADDQKAVVNENLTLELITNVIPNVKHGERIGQKLLNRLQRLKEGTLAVTSGENRLKDWEMQIAENIILGIRWRLNAMACAMMMDTFTYNRFGVQIAGATWGMPSDLKVTVATAWGANPTTADPLGDILAIDQTARLKYGIEFDTVTMGTLDFREMTATTSFANRASLILQAHFLTGPNALLTRADPQMKQLAQQILGKEIVLDDAVYNERANDGTITTTKVLPRYKVVLSRSSDHGNAQAYDMANGTPTEATVADMIGSAPAGLGREQYGPVAYYTPQAEDLNPPGIVAWGVARCFPRKFIPEATAVLTVG
jgi:hypothetical protein